MEMNGKEMKGIKVKLDLTELDTALQKAKELKQLIEEIKEAIRSLSGANETN